MRQVHLMDEIKENGWTAWLLVAFFIGIVVFAIASGGFVG